MHSVRQKVRSVMSRYLIAGLMLVCSVAPATAHVSVNIGINLPVYPQLVQVPAYPVYYAPQLSANYFFYDGMYWVYQGDRWYASSWYNGPWALVAPAVVARVHPASPGALLPATACLLPRVAVE
jgi:hypothetical protein